MLPIFIRQGWPQAMSHLPWISGAPLCAAAFRRSLATVGRQVMCCVEVAERVVKPRAFPAADLGPLKSVLIWTTNRGPINLGGPDRPPRATGLLHELRREGKVQRSNLRTAVWRGSRL